MAQITVDFIKANFNNPAVGGNVHRKNGKEWNTNDIRSGVSNKVPTKANEDVDHRIECQTLAAAMNEVGIADNSEEAFAIKKLLNNVVNLEALDHTENIQKGQRNKHGNQEEEDYEAALRTMEDLMKNPDFNDIAVAFEQVRTVFDVAQGIIRQGTGAMDSDTMGSL